MLCGRYLTGVDTVQNEPKLVPFGLDANDVGENGGYPVKLYSDQTNNSPDRRPHAQCYLS